MKRKIGIGMGILVLLLGLLFINQNQIRKHPEGDVTEELTGKQVDIVLFMGQSNMSGANGNASKAPDVPAGAGYEYRAVTRPDALFRLKEPLGAQEHKEGFLDDRELLERRGTMASAFAIAYYEKTETPVIAIAASRGSSSMHSWVEHLAEDAIDRLMACREYLESHHIQIRHCYMVWMQGEADANKETSEEDYLADMEVLLDKMEAAGVETCFLIQIGNDLLKPGHHSEIQEAQLKLCETDHRVILASDLAPQLDEELDEGGVHFNQKALNLIGQDAGCRAGIEAGR